MLHSHSAARPLETYAGNGAEITRPEEKKIKEFVCVFENAMQKDSPKRNGSLPNVVMHREKTKVYGSQEEPNPKGTCKGCLV